MLPKKNRIPRKEFPAPKAQGFRVFSPYFSTVFYKTGEITKVSIVVSKKTAKTAVSRNRLRRRFYEIISLFLNTLKTSRTIVIYPKKEAENIGFSVLLGEIEKALKQAKLL